jgi:hypothetical protein
VVSALIRDADRRDLRGSIWRPRWAVRRIEMGQQISPDRFDQPVLGKICGTESALRR